MQDASSRTPRYDVLGAAALAILLISSGLELLGFLLALYAFVRLTIDDVRNFLGSYDTRYERFKKRRRVRAIRRFLKSRRYRDNRRVFDKRTVRADDRGVVTIGFKPLPRWKVRLISCRNRLTGFGTLLYNKIVRG